MIKSPRIFNFLSYKNKFFITVSVLLTIAIFIFILLVISPYNRNQPNTKPPLAANGEINLSNWDFEKKGTISLNGEWEFYWDKLLCPKDFLHLRSSYKKTISTVPCGWRQCVFNGKKLSNEGYATYRLLVRLNSIPQNIALNAKAFISSCKIWVDDKEVYHAGIVSDKFDGEKGCFNPQLIPISPSRKEFYITVQISNFGYSYGGFVTNLDLGNIVTINDKNNRQAFADMFLFGSILIMGLYHFTLYMLRKEDPSTLFFGILCLLISLRILLMGQMLLYSFFPYVPLSIFLKLSMLTIYLGLTFFVMFINKIFPEDTPKWIVKFTQATSVLFSAIAIIFQEKYSNSFFTIYEIIGTFILIILFAVLINASAAKRESSFIVLSAVLLVILITVNDELNYWKIISTGYYIPFGLFLFIFVQSFMLSRKFSKAFLYKEKLLKSELRMLQAQIKPHFLFNALNTIISVCRESPEKAEGLLLNLSNYLRCGFSFKNDDEFVSFETEMLHVKSYLYIEQERFSGKLNVIFDVDSNIHCKIPAFILQPIVENAVKHGILPRRNGGTLKLTAKETNNILTVIIEDDGIGMTEAKLNSILEGSNKNAGIGVSNVKKRIEKIYGKSIEIRSFIGEGTSVTFKLPLTTNGRF